MNYNEFNCFIIICIILSEQFVANFQFVHQEERGENYCKTYNQKDGNCIPYKQCPSLTNTRNFRVLRASICGFRGHRPLLCCPNNIPTPSKTTPKPTPPSTPIPTPKPPLSPFEVPKKFSDFECGEGLGLLKRIVGGEPARPGAWPWMAALLIEEDGIKSHQCGATLVNHDTILTAAHCVILGENKTRDPSTLTIRLGEHNIDRRDENDAAIDYDVKSVIAHERFNPRTYLNDIAILKLTKNVDFNSRISPACLPYNSRLLRSTQSRIEGRQAIVTGWGRVVFNGPTSAVLQQASFEVYNQDECKTAYKRYLNITGVYICASNTGNTIDSCQGDSGGPLVMTGGRDVHDKWYLMGIVSFGRRCATPGFPGVYTRITEFLDWINKHA